MTRLRYGWFFNDRFVALFYQLYSTFTAECDGERILKIGQHLAKLWVRVECAVFLFDSWGNLILLALFPIMKIVITELKSGQRRTSCMTT